MRAGVLIEPCHVEVRQVEKPAVPDGTVLVRMRTVGICGSDLHTYRGEHPFRKPPVILGHEGAGDVVASPAGDVVASPAAGPGPATRVAILPAQSCRSCRECETGLPHLCAVKQVPGSGWPGFLSEYVAVPPESLVPLGPDISYAEGAMIEPVAVAWHAVRSGGVLPGQSVAVLGGGSIGALIAMVCHLHRADPLLVSDVREHALRLLADLGIARTVNAARQDVVAAARGSGTGRGTRGFDVVFVASGHPSCLDEAFALAGARGTVVVLPMFGTRISIDPNPVVLREITVQGSTTYSPGDFRAAARLVNSRDLDVRPLISETITLDGVQQALEAMDRGHEAIKVQVDLDC